MHIIGKTRSLSQSAGWQFVTKLIRSKALLESNFRFATSPKLIHGSCSLTTFRLMRFKIFSKGVNQQIRKFKKKFKKGNNKRILGSAVVNLHKL